MTQGASSAYGAMTVRRTDKELHELIDICSAPESHEDRVTVLRKYGNAFPELKNFFIVAYFCKDAFKSITDMGEFGYIASKVAPGASEENLASMWREVTRMYDTFPTGPKVKRGRAQRILGTLYAKDAEYLYKLIFGNFYSKELNELVVKEAFPELVPKT
jgi:hypothetical protein